MKVVLVTDAWFPQVNGVVRTLSTVLCFHFVAATVLLFPNSVSALASTLTHFWG